MNTTKETFTITRAELDKLPKLTIKQLGHNERKSENINISQMRRVGLRWEFRNSKKITVISRLGDISNNGYSITINGVTNKYTFGNQQVRKTYRHASLDEAINHTGEVVIVTQHNYADAPAPTFYLISE